MFARSNVTGGAIFPKAAGFLINLIPAVTLLAIGCSLTLATIRMILIGQILIVAGLPRLTSQPRFSTARSRERRKIAVGTDF